MIGDRADRRFFLGGSDARVVMGSDEDALTRLWREKRGEVQPEDLSANLIVQLGRVTENLNRHWFKRNTGLKLNNIERQVRHPTIRWMAATLDGVVAETGAVFEAKFMLPWSFSEEVAAQKYMPQLQHNMWVVAQLCPFSDHRRRQVGRDHGLCRPVVPAPPPYSGAKVLALRPNRRAAPVAWGRAAATTYRSGARCRHE
jgi:YqaJ-like recombinase protein